MEIMFQSHYVVVVVFDNIVQDKAIYDCCVREFAQADAIPMHYVFL